MTSLAGRFLSAVIHHRGVFYESHILNSSHSVGGFYDGKCSLMVERSIASKPWQRRSFSSRGKPTSCKFSLDSMFLSEFSGVQQDIRMMILGTAGAYLWVRIFDELARKEILDQKLSRKIVHISTGLIYMLLWPFFSENPDARIFASLVPLFNVAKLVSLAFGIVKDDAAVRAISRKGDPKELLQGPLYYVFAFSALIFSFWRTSPPGIIGLSLMCGGDGFADIVGRRFGGKKLPWNSKKSWAGSSAMLFFGFSISLLFTYWFSSWGYYGFDLWETGMKVLIISLACTIAESLPQDIVDDNLSVPLTAGVVGYFLFH